jgi:SHS2 domain-containing protein
MLSSSPSKSNVLYHGHSQRLIPKKAVAKKKVDDYEI